MMKDYLIIAWITIVACWPITLPVLAVVAGILFYSRHRVAGVVVSGCLSSKPWRHGSLSAICNHGLILIERPVVNLAEW